MKCLKFSLCIFVGCLAAAEATEYSPWFGRVLEIETRAENYFEIYNSIEAAHGNRHQPAGDLFIDLNASLAPTDSISAEVEFVLADTRHRSFGWDSFLLTARYKILNDVTAEYPLSFTAGLSFINTFKPARHDIAVFHHGGVAGEFHVAAGKEFSYQQYWTSRLWGVVGAGLGDIGSAWIRGDAHWEHNWCDRHQLELFMFSLWGLGMNNLNLNHHFHGYGSIDHQSIDTGLRYTFFFDGGWSLNGEYAYRVYAHNCPQRVNWLSIGIFYSL